MKQRVDSFKLCHYRKSYVYLILSLYLIPVFMKGACLFMLGAYLIFVDVEAFQVKTEE